MAKKSAQRRPGPTRKSTKRQTAGVHVDVKVGILHTIADAIYSTTAGKVREAVANARDNDATWIVIMVDRTTRTLTIYDNGCGITQARIKEVFDSIGYGLLQDVSETKLSYFGIGLMSIFQLGESVHLFTRPVSEGRTNLVQVNAKAIFDRAKRKESISYLTQQIQLTEGDAAMRDALPAPVLDDFLAQEPFAGSHETFTEIVVEGVSDADLDTMCDPAFEDELRKLLPLRVDREEPFLKRFTGKAKPKDIREILNSQDYCQTIDVYFGVVGEQEPRQLWKYFPRFRADLRFPDDNIYVGTTVPILVEQ